jgi:hypothetical protein
MGLVLRHFWVIHAEKVDRSRDVFLRPECKKAAGLAAAAFFQAGGRAMPSRHFTVALVFPTGSQTGAAD